MLRRISQVSLRGKLYISGIVFLICLGAMFTANAGFFGKVMATKNAEPNANIPAFDPGDWVNTASMPTARNNPSASLLPSGDWLVVGGFRTGQSFLTDAAIFKVATKTWQTVAPIPAAHRFSAQLLTTGDVLVVGDDDNTAPNVTSYLFTETSTGGTWAATTGAPSIKRYQPSLSLLTTGTLAGYALMAGGYDNACCSGPNGTYKTTELYNPATKTWSAGPMMNVARLLHTATVLNDGRVLVAGGALRDPLTAYNSSEFYTSGGNWTVSGSMAAARYAHTATLLPSGEVLVVGGANGVTALNSVELYNPVSNTWTTKAPTVTRRHLHTATLLPSGKVLIAGGQDMNGVATNSAELYDPATNTWSDAGPLNNARGRHVAALIPCGQVVIAGGSGGGSDLASTEIYTQKDPLITLSPTTLANGFVGQMFMQSFSNTGAMAPLTYSFTGTLPKGMTLQTDGKLTGIPEEKGIFSFTVKVTDKNGCMATVDIRWQVDCPNIVIAPATVHNGVAGQVYSPIEQLSATGGTAPYTYAVTSGLLPTGMTLTNDGKLQGAPMQSGNFSFQVTVTDKFGCTGIRVYPLTIVCDTITITPENMQLPDAMQAMEYNTTIPLGQTFSATGGCGQYSFSISAGQLPAGMSLSSSGALSGVPTKSGDYEFTVKVTDKCGCMTTKVYKLKVACPFRSLLNQSLFNTGVSNAGTLLADGAKDPHYNVTPPNSGAFVVAEYPGWILNSDSTASKWISHSANRESSASEYSYKVIFDLSSCDPNSVVIQGRWAADNGGAIYVNGVKASSGEITGNTGFKQWQSFTLNSGFNNSATNTIEFRVSDEGVVSGLRVEFQRAIAKCCGCAPPPRYERMISWHPLDEVAGATTIQDIRGTHNGQSKAGAVNTPASPMAMPGMVKGSLYFNGNGNFPHVEVQHATPLNLASDEGFTIDAWINIDQRQTDQKAPIVDKMDYQPGAAPPIKGYAFYVQQIASGNQLVFDIAAQNGNLFSTTATVVNVLTPGRWHHVAISYDRNGAGLSSATAKFYVDGQLVVSSGSPSNDKVTNSLSLLIGKTRYTNDENKVGGIKIDELEIFDVPLAEGEIRNIYSAFSDGKCRPCANANITLTNQPNPLPMGTAGVVYSDTQFTAAGGTGPYMYSATGLSPGMSLSMDGKLTGTPTQQGNYTFVITVKDANGCIAEFRREVIVKCREFNIKPDFLPAGFVGTVYPKQTFTTDSACPPVTYTISGTLPPGLTFANGMLQGTPAAAGSFTFTVAAVDACGCPGRKTYTVVIKDCPRIPIKGLFNTGVDNSKAPLTVGAPDGHYTLTTQNGSVASPVVVAPANGWATSSTARWIGRPGGAGGVLRFTTQFDLSGCDLSSVLISGRFAASLNGQLFLNNSTTPIAQTPTNGATSLTPFTITSGFQAGPNTLTFVTTAAAQQGGLLVEFTEATAKCCDCPAITIGPNALSVGNLNQAYGPVTLTASGGMAPYTYSIIGGGLPAGMTLSSAGAISGTPTAAGNFVIKVLVVDGMGCTGMRQYELRIRRRLVSYSTSVIQSSSLSGEQVRPTLVVTVTLGATALERRWTFGITPTGTGSGLQSSGLSNPRAFIGPDAVGGQLTVNNSQIAQNRLGLEIAMPPGQTVGNGDKHVFTLMYDIAPSAIGARFGFEFGDSPTPRGIFDVNGNSLPADFSAPQFVLAPSVANVSAASYQSGALAPEEIVSAFGVKLATTTVAASSVPLPTTLAGTTVKVRDSANVERPAPLFFVAPTQINYMIPAGTAPGAATVLITSGDGTVSGSVVEIAGVAPGIFVADASGRGLPAANALTFRADGSSSSAAVARFDTTSNKFVAVPVELGTITDRVFLSLFATGVRKRTSLDNVRAIIGGVESPVFFAGDQGGFAGLDQINIEIPRSLAGSGLVDVTLIVDGQIANVVQVNIR